MDLSNALHTVATTNSVLEIYSPSRHHRRVLHKFIEACYPSLEHQTKIDEQYQDYIVIDSNGTCPNCGQIRSRIIALYSDNMPSYGDSCYNCRHFEITSCSGPYKGQKNAEPINNVIVVQGTGKQFVPIKAELDDYCIQAELISGNGSKERVVYSDTWPEEVPKYVNSENKPEVKPSNNNESNILNISDFLSVSTFSNSQDEYMIKMVAPMLAYLCITLLSLLGLASFAYLCLSHPLLMIGIITPFYAESITTYLLDGTCRFVKRVRDIIDEYR